MPRSVRSQHSDNVNAWRPGFEIVTFDCYGTLIDWESGIREAFQDAMRKAGQQPVSANKLLELYGEEERRVEEERPYKSYRDVQSRAVKAVAQKVEWNIDDSNILSAALPKWKPYSDTNPALERLSQRYKLGILSNVDNDFLASTLAHFTVPFEIIITAEQVKSYKPHLGHFEAARKAVGTKRWLHVAGSIYHDIEPATRIGIQAVWVKRKRARLGPSTLSRTVKEVRDLTELADWLQV